MKHLKPILALLLLFLAACGGTSTPPEPTTSDVNPAVQAVFETEVSSDESIPIPKAHTAKNPGDELVIEGRIMGTLHPFVKGRAVFVLGDNDTITPCSDMADDHCETPWDACCDPNEILLNGTATVQVLDQNGTIVQQGLEGVNGLVKLASVRVAGTVDSASTPEALIVNAAAVEVMP